MQIIIDPSALQQQCLAWKTNNQTIALVPTMGFFHAGHESLMEAARASCDKLVVTLFVNPTQFGPNEDLSSYPRDADRDTAIAKKHGADILFMPDNAAMYFPDHSTWVDVPDLSKGMCAGTRPTHFRGVSTVVSKLFLLAQPTRAFFGQKDWQQLAVIRRMVRDLFFPIEIVGMPIIREHDGLALSSRNAYLTPEERQQAPFLHKGLQFVAAQLASGSNKADDLEKELRLFWAEHLPVGQVDYIAFVHPETLQPVTEICEDTLVAVAVKVGKARLIDNLLLRCGAGI